jgi:hypothetical protein
VYVYQRGTCAFVSTGYVLACAAVVPLQVKDVKKAKFQLGVAEAKLGSAIQEATQVHTAATAATGTAAAAAVAVAAGRAHTAGGAAATVAPVQHCCR